MGGLGQGVTALPAPSRIGVGLHRSQVASLPRMLCGATVISPSSRRDQRGTGQQGDLARVRLPAAGRGAGPLMLEGFGISKSGLMQQLLKNTTVVEAKAYLWDQLLWNVNRKTAPFDAHVKDMTGVLFTRAAGFAVFAHAGTSPPSTEVRSRKLSPDTSWFALNSCCRS